MSSRWKKLLYATAGVLVALVVAHLVVTRVSHVEPPAIARPDGELQRLPNGERRFGRSRATKLGNIWLVELQGTPEEIGYAHSRLLYGEMVENEGKLYRELDRHIPLCPLRRLLLDVA